MVATISHNVGSFGEKSVRGFWARGFGWEPLSFVEAEKVPESSAGAYQVALWAAEGKTHLWEPERKTQVAFQKLKCLQDLGSS